MMSEHAEHGSRRRTAEVRVKLSPEIRKWLDDYCVPRGLLPASHVATIIGDAKALYERNQELQRLGVLEMTRQAAGAFTPDFFAQVYEKMGLVPDAEGGQAGRPESSAGPEAAAPSPECSRAASVEGDRVRTAT